MLRNKVFTVNDFMIYARAMIRIGHPVSQLIEGIHNHPKSLAFIVTLKILHVLEYKGHWPLSCNNSCDIEK